jgi:Raf kinase inhibitor-like YbhB/YbcL family protein
VFGIPRSVTELPSGAADGGLPEGAVQLRNDAGFAGFVGAAPPAGHGPHSYYVVVHALDTDDLGVPADATCAYLGFNLFGHTLARGTIVGTHEVE